MIDFERLGEIANEIETGKILNGEKFLRDYREYCALERCKHVPGVPEDMALDMTTCAVGLLIGLVRMANEMEVA